jgi:hypothetical protein
MKEIALTKGLVAMVDDEDFDLVSRFKWHALRRGRVVHATRTVKRDGRKWTVYMHRWLLAAPAGLEVDHRNGNGLDNRRENLRIATHAQNAINHARTHQKTSRFRGVLWNKARKRWRVVICAGRIRDGASKQIHVGTFADEVEAAKAYDRAALLHHGDFAVLNFEKDTYV